MNVSDRSLRVDKGDLASRGFNSLPLEPIAESIPAFLKRYKLRWSLWTAKWDRRKKKGLGGWNKLPVALDGTTGLSVRSQWHSFSNTLNALEERKLECRHPLGLGFNLTRCKDLTIGDIDGCVSPTGEISPWAQDVITRATAYAELSPSGTGIRFAGLGRASCDWSNHERGIEIYAGHAPRFLTFTGRRLLGSPEDLQPFPDGFLENLRIEYRGKRSDGAGDRLPPPDMPNLIDEDDLPRLEQLRLPGYVLAFLEDGVSSHGDGSQALFATTIQLLEGTAAPDGRLRPDVVFSLLASNPHAWDVATRHRHDDEGRALVYLWKHHVVPGMAKAKPVVFENLDELDAEVGVEYHKKHGLDVFALSDLAGQQVPVRQWVVEGVIPAKAVTLLYGDGGVGKSLLSLQLAVAMATGAQWVGLACASGGTLYLSAEDDKDEIHIRTVDVAAASFTSLENLTGVRVAPLAGRDAVLAEATAGRGKIEATTLWNGVRAKVAELRPALVIIDNLADVFAGNENERTLAQQFVALMRGLCADFQTTVLLLAHPSQAGISSGTGTSGSTAWHNSVRSRLYFKRPDNTLPETDLRVLEIMKNNYGTAGKVLATVQWRSGVFYSLTESDRRDQSEAHRGLVREAFMVAFTAKEKAGLTVSPNRSASYAPSVFAREAKASKDANATRYTSDEYAIAMMDLLSKGVLAKATKGPKSKATEILIRGNQSLQQVDLSADASPTAVRVA